MIGLTDGQVVMFVMLAAVLVWLLLALVVAWSADRREHESTLTMPPPARDDLLNAGPCQCPACKARS